MNAAPSLPTFNWLGVRVPRQSKAVPKLIVPSALLEVYPEWAAPPSNLPDPDTRVAYVRSVMSSCSFASSYHLNCVHSSRVSKAPLR